MIESKEVLKLAKLARIQFNESQIANFTNQLSNVINMLNELKQVDCSNVEPLTSVSDMHQSMRSDIITEKDITNELFVNVTKKQNTLVKDLKCFIVPKVVE